MTSSATMQHAAVGFDPFAGGELARVVPSTEPQREIWLADRLGRDASLSYNESVSLQLTGVLDAQALAHALDALVARHDALRSNFGPDGETLCVRASLEVDMTTIDLRAQPATDRQASLDARTRSAVDTPFSLGNDALLRAELIRMADDEHVLLLTAHHAVCDGWSWWVLVRELGALYSAQRERRAPTLEAAEQFADYALALAREPASTHAADLAFWRARFAQDVPALDLPTDRARAARRGFASEREDYVLPATLVAGLRRLGAQRGASLFATLLTGFATLLGRLASQDSIVVGIPAAAQGIDGHDGLVGHCVNLLPLRFDLDPNTPFAQALDAGQGVLFDALEHSHCTFGTLLQHLPIARDPSRLPLVSAVFNIDQALDGEAEDFSGLALRFSSNARTHENFELFVNAVQEGGALRLECQYNTDLFDRETVRRWLGCFESLLQAAVDAPQRTLAELPLLDDAALAALRELQPAATPFDRERLAHQFFERQADATPDRIAVRGGKTSLTYAELEVRANQLAHLLRERGVHRGSLVGLALDRDVDMLVGVLATLKAGAGYVPLDPALPDERLAYMVGDAGLSTLVTQSQHAARFDLRGRPVLALDALGTALSAQPDARIGIDGDAAQPDSVAYVIYTSGSTGRPKGVQVPHATLANFVPAMLAAPGMHADDVLVSVTTLSFDIAVFELLVPLAVGACVVIASRDEQRDSRLLRALLERSNATCMQATPAGWRLLLESGWAGHSTFKAVSGGEPLAVELAQALLARCGEVWNGYGPTETTIYSTFWRVQSPEQGIRIGRPVANTQAWVLDPHGQPLPRGVPGELWLGGAGVTLGYLGREDLTRERFVEDRFDGRPGARLYRTGDRVRWHADGTLEHMGRLDFQLKLRGYRIEPGEIETVLAAHPRVARASVMAREDRPGDVRLVAYYTASSTVDARELDHYLRQSLPEYMVPAHLVALDAFPHLPNGKLDRAALPAPMAPVAAAARGAANATEAAVLEAMRRVLGAPALGMDDDFFMAGGHSLLAAQLVARLERELGATLTLRALFEAPTAARLATLIDTSQGGASAQAMVIARREDRDWAPLSLMQQRLWVLEQMEPDRVTWNTPSAHRLRGPFDMAAFQAAFAEVVRRQPSLRTTIAECEGVAMQRIHAHVDATLVCEDLSSLPLERREARLHDRLAQLTAQPFNLELGPLFRARLFRMAGDEHVLFFMPHHVIWDGWSFDLLYAEMSALYTAFCAGQPSPLPELAIDYGDFSAWHLEWLQGPELAGQLDYWRAHLANPGEPLHLPQDRPRPAEASGEGSTEWLSIDRETADALRTLGSRSDATLFMTLLAAWYALLAAMSGQRDLVVGLPVRNRDRTALEPVMGFFVNMLPLRLQVDPDETFATLLTRVRAAVVDALKYPDVPFEQLLRVLDVPRDPSRSPVYQALFSFQDARARQTRWGELEHEHLLLFQRGAANDVGLWFLEHAGGLSGGLTYNTDILDARSAQRFGERLHVLLRNLLAQPDAPLAQLDCVAEADRAVVAKANATACAVPDVALHTLLLSALAGEARGARIECDGQRASAAQLAERSERIAAALQARGVRAGDCVGVAVERSVDLPATLLGIARTGAAYVPLDPGFPESRLQFMARDAGLVQIVGDAALAARLGWPRTQLLDLAADAVELAAAPPANAVAVDPSSACYLIYTSGSTGTPKGVRVPHRAVVNFLHAMREAPGLSASDTLVAVTTVSFDIAVLELFLPLWAGARLVIAPRDVAQDATALTALLRDANCMQATPSTWRMLLDAGWEPRSGFRAFCGGEPLAPDLAERLLAAGAELWNMYGPTETTVWSTCARVVTAADISIGRPIANTEVHIVNAHGAVCPPGVSGELVIGGLGVALGYHARAELTAERFVRDAWSARPGPDGTAYRTGDLARWRMDGTLEHLGRLDHQVKLRGHRIELGEIETALLDNADVARAVAVVREDRPGDARLVAYAVPHAGRTLDVEAQLVRLRARLPGYMVPQHFVILDALPLLPNGKTDRNALPSPLQFAQVQAQAPLAAPVFEDPRTAYLAGVWSELLGVQAGPADNFFDLGGHSMLAVQMASRVARDTGVRLKLMRLVSQDLRQIAAELPAVPVAAPAAPAGGRLARLKQLFARGA